MPMKDEFGFSIDLTVRSEWRNIDLLRTSVQNCFTAVFADVDGCHAIAMVTGVASPGDARHVRGSIVGTSTRLARSQTRVGRAAARQRSHEADDSCAEDDNAAHRGRVSLGVEPQALLRPSP